MKAIFAAPVRGDDPAPQWARWPISQVMSRPVVPVGIGVSLDQAMPTMLHTGVRHLAVLDPAGRCAGVLAARSVAAVVGRRGGRQTLLASPPALCTTTTAPRSAPTRGSVTPPA